MNKTLLKLIAVVMALIISVVMVVTISYAWTTISTAPIAEGIQITIGGGHTIMMAPDISKTVDGTTFHYPGFFDDTLNFSQYEQYDYLKQVSALLPVSTADGINWFIPEYYDILDEAVINGTACVGEGKPITEFTLDDLLEYANLTEKKDKDGHYIYLDFWVVSPGSDCTLRVSEGDENGGSYLLELMAPTLHTDGSFTLDSTSGTTAASARVGFLVNPDYVTDNTMLYYQQSYTYKEQYQRLRGSYGERGSKWYSSEYNFTIYEPNGDFHPNGEKDTYVITSPLGYSDGQIVLADIRDSLAVQLKNGWKTASSAGIGIEEVFQTAIAGKNINSEAEAKDALYNKYLQGNFIPYVTKGSFVTNTEDLYSYYASGNIVDTDEMSSLGLSGAAESTYIVKLEKNVPQRIRMFVWIEGQDVDCTGAEAVDFAISIELAGSTQDIYE